MTNNDIKIYWYNIKFFDKNNKILQTITEDELKEKIAFWETINNWQGSMDIVLNKDLFEYNDNVFACKVYYIINIDWETREEHLYTWIINDIRLKTDNKYTEVIYNFVWLYSFYKDIEHFRIKLDSWTSYIIEKTYEENNNNIWFIEDNIFKSLWFTEIKALWEVLPWYKIIWDTTWVEAEVVYHHYDLFNNFIWIYKQTWRFNNLENCKIYEKIMATWVYTWNSTQIIEYTKWDNITNYFLDYDWTDIDTPITWTKNIKIDHKMNNEVLDYLKDLNEGYYYYIDKNWHLYFTTYWTTDLLKTLTYDKEVIEVEYTKDKNAVKNYITVWNEVDPEVVVFDIESIEKYGRKEMKTIVDKDLLNIDTLTDRANKELYENKDWIVEVVLKLNMKKYILSVLYKTWQEMTLTAEQYTGIKIKDLKTYIEWWSVFNIQIWDRLNVHNLDYNALLRDMIVVRKEFDWDYMNIYLGKYRKNYALT